MPNCKKHEDCDLVCSTCGDYYCLVTTHFPHVERKDRWVHIRRQDMPDDIEAYRNERAKEGEA